MQPNNLGKIIEFHFVYFKLLWPPKTKIRWEDEQQPWWKDCFTTITSLQGLRTIHEVLESGIYYYHYIYIFCLDGIYYGWYGFFCYFINRSWNLRISSPSYCLIYESIPKTWLDYIQLLLSILSIKVQVQAGIVLHSLTLLTLFLLYICVFTYHNFFSYIYRIYQNLRI